MSLIELILTASKEHKEKIKKDLKTRAKYIRSHKALYKQKQRTKSKFEISAGDWYWKGHNYNQWALLDKDQFKEMQNLQEIRETYRIRHIVYSMMRGKSIKQIESKTKKERQYDAMVVYSKAKKMLHSLGLTWIG